MSNSTNQRFQRQQYVVPKDINAWRFGLWPLSWHRAMLGPYECWCGVQNGRGSPIRFLGTGRGRMTPWLFDTEALTCWDSQGNDEGTQGCQKENLLDPVESPKGIQEQVATEE